jgi:hypothetical protein
MVINYAIEVITTSPDVTDSDYGITSGVFRWITGRPNYDGSTNIPTNEDATNNTHVWYENWIVRKGISDPSRSVDISQTGDYGTFSGFSFTIRNDTKIWDFINDNSIYLTNRTVNVYVIIDDVFYQIWQGIISNNPYNESDYRFECIDAFKKIHKTIPPDEINKTVYPDSASDEQGKSVPVVFGDVAYSKVQTVKNETTLENLIYLSDGSYGKAAGAVLYESEGKTIPELTLYTKGVSFAEDALAGKYLYTVRGENADTDELIRISSNDATVSDLTKIYIETVLGVDDALFSSDYAYNAYGDTYYPQIPITNTFLPSQLYTFSAIDFSNNGIGSNKLRIFFDSINTSGGIIYIYEGATETTQLGFIEIPATFANNKIFYGTIPHTTDSSATISLKWDGPAPIHPNWLKAFYNASSFDTWWFSIVDMSMINLISNSDVSEIVTDSSGIPLFYRWNADTLKMESVSNIIDSLTIDKSGNTGHPQINAYNSVIQKDGSVKYYTPIIPSYWSLSKIDDYFNNNDFEHPVENYTIDAYSLTNDSIFNRNTLGDRNNTSSSEIKWGCGYNQGETEYRCLLNLEFPSDQIEQNYDTIYVGIDFIIKIYGDIGVQVSISMDMIDAYGNTIIKDDTEDGESSYPDRIYYPIDDSKTTTGTINMFMLPNNYYKLGGTQEMDSTFWGYSAFDDEDNPDDAELVRFREMMEVPSDILDGIKAGTLAKSIKLTIKIHSSYDVDPQEVFIALVSFRQAGFVGVKTVNTTSEDFYVRLKGETAYGEETNTVYKCFRHILQDYDNIETGMIDYTNLPTTRDDWYCGRQIETRKESTQYLRELAQHSFIGIFTSKTGKIILKAWREDEENVLQVNQSSIIRDSISSFTQTPMTSLCNDFSLWYDWNPGSKNFSSSLTITNTDIYYPVSGGVTGAAGFPSPTMMSDYPDTLEMWKVYAGGIAPSSYADAKRLWDVAHEGYDRAAAVQTLPDNLSKLYWFNNSSIFNSIDDNGASIKDAAYKYLTNLVEWTTLQKDLITFELPINSTYVTLELLDYITIIDPIYTNNESRYGWITNITVNTNKNTLKLQAILKPLNSPEDDLIIERGILLNTDVFVESGTEPDQVRDGGGRF